MDPAPLLAETQTLRVTGMTCASCVATIERALVALPGVTSAKVNLATETALVHGSPLDRAALVAAIEKSGYGVASGSARQVEAKISDADRVATRRLLVCAALTIPLVILSMGPHLAMLLGLDGAMDMGGMDMAGTPGDTNSMPPGGMETPGAPSATGMPGMGMNGMDMAGMDMGGMDTMQMGSMDMAGMDMEGMDMDGMDMGSMDAMQMGGMDMGGTPPASTPGQGAAAPDMMLENAWPQLLLAAPVVAYGGAPIFRGAWKALRGRHVTMDTLIALGVTTAFTYSAAITVRPEWALGPGLYFETAAVIVTLILLGRRIEHRARKRAAAMMDAVTETGSERSSQVRQIMEDAQGSRIGIQAAVDRVVRLFVPLVLFVAVGSFLFWWTFGAPIAAAAGFAPASMALLSLLAVLIIACPCGLGLAIPMAVMAGTSRGAQQGILIRSGEALEASRTIDTVVFEKSGILTAGNPEVKDVIALAGSEQEVLALAGAVEAQSRHPLGIAIHRRAQSGTVPLPQVSDTAAEDGHGMQARSPSGTVLVGRPQWLAAQGIATESAAGQMARLRAEGKTVVAVAQNGRLVGLIALHDAVKPTSQAAVKQLQAKGFEVVLLAGDDQATTNALASSLGIKRVLAEVAPADRAATIRRLRQEEGRRVAVVGDGLKDAAILAEANLGIALGPGDLTKHAGGILLLKDDPTGAAAGIDLARHTLRKVHQNLAWAFAYNVALIPVAAGLLVAWPIFGGPLQLDPMYGAVAMTLSIVSVVANSTQLRKWQPSSEQFAAVAAGTSKPARSQAAQASPRVPATRVEMVSRSPQPRAVRDSNQEIARLSQEVTSLTRDVRRERRRQAITASFIAQVQEQVATVSKAQTSLVLQVEAAREAAERREMQDAAAQATERRHWDDLERRANLLTARVDELRKLQDHLKIQGEGPANPSQTAGPSAVRLPVGKDNSVSLLAPTGMQGEINA